MKTVASIILGFLLGAMFMSLFHMSSGMDMTGGMTNCPFMSHNEVICPMNFADHLESWKSAFHTSTPATTLLLLVVGSLVFISTLAPHLIKPKQRPIRILYRQLKERTYTYYSRPLQELYAAGILNPKLF